MSTIAIIGDKHDWHSEQLETTFKKKGYAVLKIKFNQLRADFNNSEKNFTETIIIIVLVFIFMRAS